MALQEGCELSNAAQVCPAHSATRVCVLKLVHCELLAKATFLYETLRRRRGGRQRGSVLTTSCAAFIKFRPDPVEDVDDSSRSHEHAGELSRIRVSNWN